MIHASVYKRRNNHFIISVMLMVVHCIQTCFVTTHLPFKLNAFNLIQPASGFYMQQCPSLRARGDKHSRTFLQPSQHQPTVFLVRRKLFRSYELEYYSTTARSRKNQHRCIAATILLCV